MRHAMNIFGSTAINPRSDSRGALSFGASRDDRLGRNLDWSGLHERKPFEIDVNRVAVQLAWRWGIDQSGKTVPVDWQSPIFVSRSRAEHLIATGKARFCGLSGGGEGK